MGIGKARPTCFGRFVCVFVSECVSRAGSIDASIFKDANKIVRDPRRFDDHANLAIDSKVRGISGQPVQAGDRQGIVVPSEDLGVQSGPMNRTDIHALRGELACQVGAFNARQRAGGLPVIGNRFNVFALTAARIGSKETGRPATPSRWLSTKMRFFARSRASRVSFA